MTDPCKERQLRVIDNDLIEKCIDLQYPKGEVGRLLREKGISMDEVKQIRFEYLNILKIDHLWILKTLTKLGLNNNLIEKIENLDSLVHLKELDLSFNNIKKIENLDALINLEKINFYENLIEIVENMEKQTKLAIFSIGKNKLVDKSNVNYFRKFPNLISLNMAENPCTHDQQFRCYVAAYLPNLVYYEYRRITDEERNLGNEIFEESLRTLQKEEAKEYERKSALQKKMADTEMHCKMFVDGLDADQLFEEMFEHDPEGKALLEIGEDATELYEEYKSQFVNLCKTIFEIGEKYYNLRQTEMDEFTRCIENAKRDNKERSIEIMELFLEKKTELFNEVKKYQVQLDHDAITEDQYKEKVEQCQKNYDTKIHFTWKKLMTLEMTLFEQIEEVNQLFEQNMTEIINNLIEAVQAIFTNLRATEVSYAENIHDAATRYLAIVSLNADETLSKLLKNIMTDRDSVNNAMAATHDVHMQIIDGREDRMVNTAKRWFKTEMETLANNAIIRNRHKLLEINHFLDIQREEFEDLATTTTEINNEELEI
ncbi:dynein regulatory complex subunit 3-like [Cylas formicarius]|uniref:dynein regulatory complex subunit 3-like n=1 Tax=Cylas formicarius TaxID=197179 RepID=UPI002958BBBE|nr:dynein regulatory complex subunit 3-like [Cylas formicarius]